MAFNIQNIKADSAFQCGLKKITLKQHILYRESGNMQTCLRGGYLLLVVISLPQHRNNIEYYISQ